MQDHIGSLLDSVTAYTQKECEDEITKLLRELAHHCEQDHRLKAQVQRAVCLLPSVVSQRVEMYTEH